MRRVAVCLLLGLTGCPTFTADVARPPTYDDNCTPSDQFYWELAASTVDMAATGEIPTDPMEAYKLALQEVEERNVKIIPKAQGMEDWSKFNTTFPKKIYTSKEYNSYSDAGKAVVLWHEIVHLREYDRHGAAKFFTMYAFAEGRWALEVQAYRQSYRIRRLWGEDEESIRADMHPRIEEIYDAYDLSMMPRECAIQGAIGIWMEDSP